MADNSEKTSKSALKKAQKQEQMAAQKAAKTSKQAALPVVGGKKADDIIGITVSKAENFSGWYQEVVLKAEMIEYYNEISGFFILRPSSMYIWNTIRKWFQERIEAMDVEEASFPMFLSSKSLEKEKDHVEGFAPELAWVTKAFVFTPPLRRLDPNSIQWRQRPRSSNRGSSYLRSCHVPVLLEVDPKPSRPSSPAQPMEQCRSVGSQANNSIPTSKRILVARGTYCAPD
jgi:prolyl-tRNA synthetase